MMHNILRIAVFTSIVLAFVGCATPAPPSPTESLTAPELFQRAQDAADKGSYSVAIQYYDQVKTRYPDDTAHQAWAQYEIAMLYHKMGNNTKAIELFDALLARYAAGEALPDAPRVLAQKVRDELVAAQPKKPAASPAPQPSPAP